MGIPKNLFRHRTAEVREPAQVRKQPEITEPVRLPEGEMEKLIHDVRKTPVSQKMPHERNDAMLGRHANRANHATELHLLGMGEQPHKKPRTRRPHAPHSAKPASTEALPQPNTPVVEVVKAAYDMSHGTGDEEAVLKKEIAELRQVVEGLQQTVGRLLETHRIESAQEPAFHHELFREWWRDHQGLFGTSAFSARWKGNGVAFAIGLQHGVYEALGDDKKDELRNVNRRNIIAGSVGLLTMGGIGALRQDMPSRERLVSTELLARYLTIEGLEAAVQQSIIDEAQRRIGETLLRDLTQQECNEYQAIIDGNQDVIDAWLTEHAAAYRTSLLFQEFESGVEADPDHTPADKAFAVTAWVQEKVLGIAERTQLSLIDYKKEVVSLRHA